jgi:DNA-binding NarL/FixJ family response regulator
VTGTPIRIALADDQPLFSAGLKMILRSQADMDLVGEAVNGEAAVTLAEETRPDVLLMDIRMPVMDGITATRTILETPAGSATKIIVLTTIQHDEAVVRAIQAGAAGFLTKDTTPEFLLAAIRTVHAGHSVIAPALTNELLRDYTTPSSNDAVLVDLSGRERDVFLLTAKGLGNAEIAASLVLSEATVKSHVGSILAKLKLKNRIQLVAFAYENNVLN